MANRLEKETILREKQQLQAKLDQLFAAQEAQTAGKKNKPGEAGLGDILGNKYWKTKSYSPNYYTGEEIPNSFDFGLSSINTQYPHNTFQSNYQYGQNSFMPNYLNPQPGRAGFGFNPSFNNTGTTSNTGGGLKSSPSSARIANSDTFDYGSPLQGQGFGGFASPENAGLGLQQSGPLPGIDYQPFLMNQGKKSYNNIFNNIGGRFKQGGGRGIANALATGLSFAGGLYDMYRGSQPADELTASDYYNPQYGAALSGYNKGLSLLANRRYNPTPELQDVERQGAIFRQGLRNSGNIGSGALRNQLAGAQTRQQRARGDIFTKKQNIDLGLMGEEAQGQFQAAAGRAGLGAQRAATNLNVAQYNAQARAGQRNLFGAGLANIGMGAQTQQLMGNQRLRDQQLLNILPSYGGGLFGINPQGGVGFGIEDLTPEQKRRLILGY